METTRTTFHTIEHVVVPADLSYQQVTTALEARLGIFVDWYAIALQFATTFPSRERVTQFIETILGSSGFVIFHKIDEGAFFSLTGKPQKIAQYTLGNPLLAVQMAEQHPEIGLYVPPRLVVYEDQTGKTFVAYDQPSSLLSPYQDEVIIRIGHLVDQKLAELVDQATQGNE